MRWQNHCRSLVSKSAMPSTFRLFRSTPIPNWVLIIAVLLGSTAAFADDYGDARAELIAAYQAEDYEGMQVAAAAALQARPGYPAALFNLALAEALRGEHVAALKILKTLAELGVDYGIEDADEFAPLQSLPGWNVYAHTLSELRQPVGDASLAFDYAQGDFVPEGIVFHEGELLLGSIRHGSIVRLGRDSTVLVEARDSGHWSVFGMRLGPDGGLWFVSAAVPQYAAIKESTLGSTGLFRLDLGSGRVTVRALLPAAETARVLGDLVFIDDKTIIASESLTGALYRYDLDSGELREVVAPGVMTSLQGLVTDAGGEHLYVADYVGGLYRVHLSDFSVARVAADEHINLFGIDGLYRYGDELIAIQNGFRPHRVAAFTLSEDGMTVTDSRVLARNLPDFDEPTLGTVVGDEMFFIANSHWNRFDRDGSLPDDLAGPKILRLKLDER